MKFYLKPIVAAIAIQSSIGITPTFAANLVELPDNQPGNFQMVGRYSTIGLGIPSQNNNLSVEVGAIVNGKAYLTIAQNCIGDRWPAGTPLAGQPVRGGVLILDVANNNNIMEVGRIPWSASNPIASDVPGQPITTTKPQYFRAAVAGVPIAEKLGSQIILAVPWSGDSCTPRFPNLTPGLNGLELWDITNPDPAQAKYLSYIQFKDINPTNALDEPRGVVPSSVHMWRNGNKNYLAVTIAGSNLGTLKIYDITKASQPNLLATWGPEQHAFGITTAAVANATSSTAPSLETLNNYIKTIDPKAFGYSVRGVFPSNSVNYSSINKQGTRAFVSAGNAGLFLLNIENLSNIKVVSVARDLSDAERRQNVGSSYSSVGENGKIVAERASSVSTFLKFTITNEPDYFVSVAQAVFTPPIANPPFNGSVSINNLVFVGDACSVLGINYVPQAQGDQYALTFRGTCSFLEKATNIQNKGYKGYILANGITNGNVGFTQGGAPPAIPFTMPSVSISHYAALKVLDPALIPSGYPVPSIGQTTYAPGLPNFPICRPFLSPPPDSVLQPMVTSDLCGKVAVNSSLVTSGFLKASGMRIWNYANEKNPVLESILDTNCSNNPAAAECNVTGVSFGASEPKLSGNTLYIPWSADGLFKLDLSKLNNPVRVGNFKDLSPAFSSQNGGPASYPIIYPMSNGCIYTSTTTGLYVFEDPTDDKVCGQ